MEHDQPGPSKLVKITSVVSTYDIPYVDHKSSDTIEYKILIDIHNFQEPISFHSSDFAQHMMGNHKYIRFT